ncbi:replication initiator [Gordonia sp. CPCC 205333]|uniref:replication initiator n=1 Tax=Gordonia sp. CPCC 205333 TaxID=3140790 RepID=UPI003AF40370
MTTTNPRTGTGTTLLSAALPADILTGGATQTMFADGVIGEMVARATHPSYPHWWNSVRASGYCLQPIHLHRGHGLTTQDRLMVRCGNRRAAVCTSCSRLYAADTWHLVHAGLCGGYHNIPETITTHPQTFLTLTAPSYGKVHPPEHRTHAGQPVQPDLYDYTGHVLFTWWAPDLWRRYTIRLRRLVATHLSDHGLPRNTVRVSFLKVHENQTRLIPHYHAIIRLDAPTTPDQPPTPPPPVINSSQLAVLAAQAARDITLTVPDPTRAEGTRTLRLGTQTDVQPLDTTMPTNTRRKIAGYLAKYVTKSVADTGITPKPISPHAIGDPAITDTLTPHAYALWHTIINLAHQAPEHYAAMATKLHTLGYRGHVTTKSRRYSTTMGHLRAIRALWRAHHPTGEPDTDNTNLDTEADCRPWSFAASGHHTHGDYQLTLTAARAHHDQLRARHQHPNPAGSP